MRKLYLNECTSEQENSGSSAFAQTLHDLIASPRAKDKWYTAPRWPSMSEVRGKAVLFCRFEWWGEGGGLHTPRWDDSSKVGWETIVGGERVVVQDWVSSIILLLGLDFDGSAIDLGH